MRDDGRRSPRPATPLDRGERAALAALADQIDRECPSLAIALRGPRCAASRSGATVRRGGVQLVLFALAVLATAAGMAGAVTVWGPLGLAVSAAALVAVLGVLTLARALA